MSRLSRRAVGLAVIAGVWVTSKIAESIYNQLRGGVKPVRGSIVYCDLAGVLEHSGVCISPNKIVHVNGNGLVEVVSPDVFLDRQGNRFSYHIYVSSCGGYAVGSEIVAQRAESWVGQRIHYSLSSDNCHRFCAFCLSGEDSEHVFTLRGLKAKSKEVLGADTWRFWDEKIEKPIRVNPEHSVVS